MHEGKWWTGEEMSQIFFFFFKRKMSSHRRESIKMVGGTVRVMYFWKLLMKPFSKATSHYSLFWVKFLLGIERNISVRYIQSGLQWKEPINRIPWWSVLRTYIFQRVHCVLGNTDDGTNKLSWLVDCEKLQGAFAITDLSPWMQPKNVQRTSMSINGNKWNLN